MKQQLSPTAAHRVRSPFRRHPALSAIALSLALLWAYSFATDPDSVRSIKSWSLSHTTPVDWRGLGGMPRWLIYGIFCFDILAWLTYYFERKVVSRKHTKYKKSLTVMWAMRVHLSSGVLETLLGFVALLSYHSNGDRDYFSYSTLSTATALVALCAHIPSGLILAPHVWGLKHVTVTGYLIVGLLRCAVALYVLMSDIHRLADLWILLHMATVVRGMTYFVFPWSTVDGHHEGDLSTDALVYTGSVSVAAAITVSFVAPAWVNLAVVLVLSTAHAIWPAEIKCATA